MNRTITFVALTFILTGLGVYLFMSQLVIPKAISGALAAERNQSSILSDTEAISLAKTHTISIVVRDVSYSDIPPYPLSFQISNYKWTAEHRQGKWLVYRFTILFT